MEATLGLVHPRPAPGARVLTGGDGTSGRRTSDRDVADVVQRVAGQAVGLDVVIDVVVGPGDERVDLHEPASLVVGHDRGRRALGGVDSLQAGDPRRFGGQVVVHRRNLAV